MFIKIGLNYRENKFLLNNGFYIDPRDVTSSIYHQIIGYCLNDSLIMSINSNDSATNWSTSDNTVVALIPSNGSGRNNTEVIIDYCRKMNISLKDNYPPVYYCKSFNPGYKNGEWYLPSIDELIIFYYNRDKFRNDCIISGIGTNMNSDESGNNRFWSSSPGLLRALDGVIRTLNIVNKRYSYNVSSLTYAHMVCHTLPFLSI